VKSKTTAEEPTATKQGGGFLDVVKNDKKHSYFLRTNRLLPDPARDIYVSESQVRNFGLHAGDFVIGQVRAPKKDERYFGLVRVDKVNDVDAEKIRNRPRFFSLDGSVPATSISLEYDLDDPLHRIIEQLSSVKFGQMGLIILPTRFKSTELFKAIAEAISNKHSQVHLLTLIVGASPATIIDMRDSVNTDIISSKSSDTQEEQLRIAELLIQHARCRVESGQEVVVLVDSISKLGQIYRDITSKPLSVELEQYCVVGNFKNGGILTIFATLEMQTDILVEDPNYRALRNHRDLVEIDLMDRKNKQINHTSYHRIFGHLDHNLATSEIFVLMPLREELKLVYDDHIKNVCNNIDLTVKRSDDIFSTGTIMNEIWTSILKARIIIADCTGRNPNVFYEIGIAHTLEKHVILITQDRDDIPFDLQHLRTIPYSFNPRGMQIFEKQLEQTLREVLERFDPIEETKPSFSI
jgi:transcription termination factor Rho